jgi:hypothetical protein
MRAWYDGLVLVVALTTGVAFAFYSLRRPAWAADRSLATGLGRLGRKEMLVVVCGIRGFCLACGEEYGGAHTCEYRRVVPPNVGCCGAALMAYRLDMAMSENFWRSLCIGMHCTVLCKLLLHRIATPPSPILAPRNDPHEYSFSRLIPSLASLT